VDAACTFVMYRAAGGGLPVVPLTKPAQRKGQAPRCEEDRSDSMADSGRPPSGRASIRKNVRQL